MNLTSAMAARFRSDTLALGGVSFGYVHEKTDARITVDTFNRYASAQVGDVIEIEFEIVEGGVKSLYRTNVFVKIGAEESYSQNGTVTDASTGQTYTGQIIKMPPLANLPQVDRATWLHDKERARAKEIVLNHPGDAYLLYQATQIEIIADKVLVAQYFSVGWSKQKWDTNKDGSVDSLDDARVAEAKKYFLKTGSLLVLGIKYEGVAAVPTVAAGVVNKKKQDLINRIEEFKSVIGEEIAKKYKEFIEKSGGYNSDQLSFRTNGVELAGLGDAFPYEERADEFVGRMEAEARRALKEEGKDYDALLEEAGFANAKLEAKKVFFGDIGSSIGSNLGNMSGGAKTYHGSAGIVPVRAA